MSDTDWRESRVRMDWSPVFVLRRIVSATRPSEESIIIMLFNPSSFTFPARKETVSKLASVSAEHPEKAAKYEMP